MREHILHHIFLFMSPCMSVDRISICSCRLLLCLPVKGRPFCVEFVRRQQIEARTNTLQRWRSIEYYAAVGITKRYLPCNLCHRLPSPAKDQLFLLQLNWIICLETVKFVFFYKYEYVKNYVHQISAPNNQAQITNDYSARRLNRHFKQLISPNHTFGDCVWCTCLMCQFHIFESRRRTFVFRFSILQISVCRHQTH